MKLESLKSSKFEVMDASSMSFVRGGANWEPTKGGSWATGRTMVVNGITYYQVHSYRSDEMKCTDLTHCETRYFDERDEWSILKP